MAYRGGRWRGSQGPRARPQGQQCEGEIGLVTAFLRQVVTDLASADVHVRTEALLFLEDRPAIVFWCSLAGIDTEAFLDHVRARGPG
jgi:hypothetical protein